MLKNILKFANDNHWYIIAGVLVAAAVTWTFGCQSTCTSLLNDSKKITRSQLQNELNYIVGQAKCYEEDLDKQDAVKQALLDAANVMGATGTINPSGLINLAASIGGISFGLSQRQKLKSATTKKTADTA